MTSKLVSLVSFLPGDSCISQLPLFVHEVNLSFDCSPVIDVTAVFINISKAFDKVWHQGLTVKLTSYRVKGKSFDIMMKYLHGQMPRVVLNGQCSSWELIQSGVPKELVLGLLLFLTYINDLRDNVKFTCKIYADCNLLFSPIFNNNFSWNELNTELQIISDWAYKCKRRFNLDPNKQAREVYFSQKTNEEDF